ncbi:hypothetical protein PVAND_017750 [Polypedilum vanderplanki]|uniref:HAT C-terminal dimerisation domain-containing protein n=1 Tax=Polypedilum vanderplanki TaxID=319348 RepID=A0A9J6B985_POLVA|nr:hypothetical protein PVAND_017750 [Polypedilum vanderplanki]
MIQLVDEEGDLMKEIQPKTTSAAVCNLVKTNSFWDNVLKLVKDIEYPSKIIGKFEADDAPLSLVYKYFGDLYNHYENDPTIQEKVKKRLEFLFSPCIGLAYILTPIYAAEGFYFDEDKTDFIGILSEYAQKNHPTFAETAENELISFIAEMTLLPQKRKEVIFKMTAKKYWNIIGRDKYPALFQVSNSIVQMISSSAIAERTWSTFKFIHSRLRNRLTNERVKKLVFMYTNSVLIDTLDKNDYILEDGAVLDEMDYEELNE